MRRPAEPFATVTVTAGDVDVFPEASLARAVNAWEPSVDVVVFQLVSYGAAVSSAPSGAPSTKNWTPAIPTSSVALAVTVIVAETVEPDAGDVTFTAGGVVSPASAPEVTSNASITTKA